MNRRDFLGHSGMLAGCLALGHPSARGLAGITRPPRLSFEWLRPGESRLFTGLRCNGIPLTPEDGGGLLEGFCRLTEEPAGRFTILGASQPSVARGPLQMELQHQLLASGGDSGEDVLQATLTVVNRSAQPQTVEIGYATSAQPSPEATRQQVYLPLNAAGCSGDRRFAPLGVADFLKDCRHQVGAEGLQCHYLEPLASYPGQRQTRALLIAPVIDMSDPQAPGRIALFTPADQPMRFSREAGGRDWRASRCLVIPAGGTFVLRGWLMIHAGDASAAWPAFHRFAHPDDLPPIGWVREFKVHYYDFLSAAGGKNARRGDGYEAAIPHFGEFRVGLSTQHGYYPCMGDCIHPDRKTWLAMKSDRQGPAEMSIAKLKARIKATRKAGARAAIYMHLTALDDSSREFYPGLAGARLVGPDGQPVRFGWNGPDVKGGLWWMSIAAPEWRAHQLQQARWIMEILQPDAIAMDETFSGLGYDEAPGRQGALGPHAIAFFKQMHDLVRSFGRDKAFFTSDCSMAGFVMWADGEVGDHAYPGLAGHPLYTQEPVRFVAALGEKPWRPCAWHFQGMWQTQMKLARLVGAGVGVSNGWIEFTGLHLLPPAVKARMIADIESL